MQARQRRGYVQVNRWSCRYLHDAHSVFKSRRHPSTNNIASTCLVCGFTRTKRNPDKRYYDTLVEHAATHRLRDCRQVIFANPDWLARHLQLDHNAIKPLSHDPMLGPWRATLSESTPQTSIGDICRYLTAGIPIPAATPSDSGMFPQECFSNHGEASTESLVVLTKTPFL